MRKTIAACVVTALAVSGTSATAASLITSAKIADGTIMNRDIHRGTISENRLDDGVVAKLNRLAAPGKDGANGLNGATGAQGLTGARGATGAQGGAGPDGAEGAPGRDGNDGASGNLPADFAFTNPSVRQTQAGVQFGRYGDGGTAGGSVRYDGLNGQKLSEITKLAYTVKHATSDGSKISAPYLRVFLNDDTIDVVLDPTECATKVPAERMFNTFSTMSTTVRYGDDACGPNAQQLSWSDVLDAHGDDVISGIYVTAGFSGGKDLTATLRDLTVNDAKYTFGG
jgi:hypothetical protein